MIRLCICEDNELDLKQLKNLIESFEKEHPEIPMQVAFFMSAYEVLEHVEKSGGFDFYILDVIMPDVDGIQLAQKIREKDATSEILFLTISNEYAIDAFRVKARNYLVKPINKADFDQEMLICVQNIRSNGSPSFMIKTKEGYRKILLQELMMIEGFNHRQVCTLSNGDKLETTLTLSSLYEQLHVYPCFYMPHRSYIINLDFVCGISMQHVLLHGGKTIPVSRKIYQDLKSVLFAYTLPKGKKENV